VTEITLSVPEIHCHHCKMAIEGAVGALPGVSRAAVDVPSARVAVAFEAPATLDQIIGAIEAQGYAVPAQA
jgi:copper chaperone